MICADISPPLDLQVHLVVVVVPSSSSTSATGARQPREQVAQLFLRSRQPVRPIPHRLFHRPLDHFRPLDSPPQHLFEPADSDSRLEVDQRDFATPRQHPDRQSGEGLLLCLDEVEQGRRTTVGHGGGVGRVGMSHGGRDEFKGRDLGRSGGREGRVRGEGEGTDIVGEGETGRDQGERGRVDARLQEGCGW